MKNVASALEYMHSVGYIHRDLTSQNLLVTDTLEAKVTPSCWEVSWENSSCFFGSHDDFFHMTDKTEVVSEAKVYLFSLRQAVFIPLVVQRGGATTLDFTKRYILLKDVLKGSFCDNTNFTNASCCCFGWLLHAIRHCCMAGGRLQSVPSVARRDDPQLWCNEFCAIFCPWEAEGSEAVQRTSCWRFQASTTWHLQTHEKQDSQTVVCRRTLLEEFLAPSLKVCKILYVQRDFHLRASRPDCISGSNLHYACWQKACLRACLALDASDRMDQGVIPR